jgi:hypothetical protein
MQGRTVSDPRSELARPGYGAPEALPHLAVRAALKHEVVHRGLSVVALARDRHGRLPLRLRRGAGHPVRRSQARDVRRRRATPPSAARPAGRAGAARAWHTAVAYARARTRVTKRRRVPEAAHSARCLPPGGRAPPLASGSTADSLAGSFRPPDLPTRARARVMKKRSAPERRGATPLRAI